MNQQRRKAIEKLRATLAKFDANEIEELRDAVQALAEEEREAYDNMPESLQQSERGEAASGAADALENAVSALESLVEAVNEADEALAEAVGE